MSRDDLIREMNVYYDRRAPWHDEYMSYHSQREHETLMQPLLDQIKERIIGKDVLEVACGTGIWTQTLTTRARSVVATDVNASVIELAKLKEYRGAPVRFEEVDAYALDKIAGSFDVAFMADWWSHIPKQRVADFLQALHDHLEKGACVIIIDMLVIDFFEQEEVRYDEDGNRISRRTVPGGGEFWVVKNFPDETELRETLSPYADDIKYIRDNDLQRWMVMYTKRG
ncbi:MAG: class I SAM-dependent methyltransferase [candidate division Zixibacteria bacterium]|nr:class I SAM-dependent methyltransferase [candidate division Zixibacteria bacterium]